jgi:PST family polysaccharide transporter
MLALRHLVFPFLSSEIIVNFARFKGGRSLAPFVLTLFYAPQFVQAAETLRWICLGVAMRVIGWPLGYVLLAKGNKRLFFFSDATWCVAHIATALVLSSWLGLAGVGIAFLFAYCLHAVLNYFLVRRLTKLRWSSANVGLTLYLLVTASIGMLVCLFFAIPDIKHY